MIKIGLKSWCIFRYSHARQGVSCHIVLIIFCCNCAYAIRPRSLIRSSPPYLDFSSSAFYVIFIHLHPIDETKSLKNNEHITSSNRPLTTQFSKMEAGKMKADEFRKKIFELVNLMFWTLKILATLLHATTKGHGEFLFRCILMKKKSVSPQVPLFSLSSKHNAVWSRYIDQGYLGRFTEIDQLTDVGGSTV